MIFPLKELNSERFVELIKNMPTTKKCECGQIATWEAYCEDCYFENLGNEIEKSSIYTPS